MDHLLSKQELNRLRPGACPGRLAESMRFYCFESRSDAREFFTLWVEQARKTSAPRPVEFALVSFKTGPYVAGHALIHPSDYNDALLTDWAGECANAASRVIQPVDVDEMLCEEIRQSVDSVLDWEIAVPAECVKCMSDFPEYFTELQ